MALLARKRAYNRSNSEEKAATISLSDVTSKFSQLPRACAETVQLKEPVRRSLSRYEGDRGRLREIAGDCGGMRETAGEEKPIDGKHPSSV